MADMVKVKAFADQNGLAIVEDAAQAHLATRAGIPAGATGVGAFSLYATKNMMSGEGGFVTTMDEDTAERARLFRNHGMVTRYDHVTWGLNFRMTDLLAAIGRAQLERLGEATERRRENASALTRELPDLFVTPRVPADAHHVFHQYTVRVPAQIRDKALEMFRERSIGADIYYPKPVHQQPSFAEFESHGACPRAESAAGEVISLPIHPKVGTTGIERIVAAATEISELLP
jgi:dTDP-4-amino-4,6-dideoxygalactose transaminase